MINPEVEIKTVENTPDDPRQRKPDITKAKELLGWEPKVKLRDGIPLMEDDFRKRLGILRKNRTLSALASDVWSHHERSSSLILFPILSIINDSVLFWFIVFILWEDHT